MFELEIDLKTRQTFSKCLTSFKVNFGADFSFKIKINYNIFKKKGA